MDGEIHDLPAIVVDVFADREPEGRAKSGYIVEVIANTEGITPGVELAVPSPQGGPANILLHAPLFPRVEIASVGEGVPAALAAGDVPGLGQADAN